MTNLFIMLPTLDEEGALEDIYRRIPIEELKQKGYTTRVVVVDGGSSDNTVEIAAELGCEVFQQWGEGKGAGNASRFQEIPRNWRRRFGNAGLRWHIPSRGDHKNG